MSKAPSTWSLPRARAAAARTYGDGSARSFATAAPAWSRVRPPRTSAAASRTRGSASVTALSRSAASGSSGAGHGGDRRGRGRRAPAGRTVRVGEPAREGRGRVSRWARRRGRRSPRAVRWGRRRRRAGRSTPRTAGSSRRGRRCRRRRRGAATRPSRRARPTVELLPTPTNVEAARDAAQAPRDREPERLGLTATRVLRLLDHDPDALAARRALDAPRRLEHRVPRAVHPLVEEPREAAARLGLHGRGGGRRSRPARSSWSFT